MHTSVMSAPRDTASAARPWYRQRWPWLLMAGPAIVVVAGFATLWLAASTDDGVIADDYYKRGLLINRTLERDRARRRAGHRRASSSIAADGGVRVTLGGNAEVAPAALTLKVAHPTRAGFDRTATLARGADGGYTGQVEPLGARALAGHAGNRRVAAADAGRRRRRGRATFGAPAR